MDSDWGANPGCPLLTRLWEVFYFLNPFLQNVVTVATHMDAMRITDDVYVKNWKKQSDRVGE